MPNPMFRVPRHGAVIRPCSFSDSDTDDYEPKRRLSSRVYRRSASFEGSSNDTNTSRATRPNWADEFIRRRDSRRSMASSDLDDAESDAHLAPLSSLFRPPESSPEASASKGEDMLTLKRANPIYEDSEDESDYVLSSPAKKMRSLSTYDDDHIDQHSPGNVDFSKTFRQEDSEKAPFVVTPTEFKHDSLWATSSFNTLETFNNAAPIYWADRLSESDVEDDGFVLPLRTITRRP